MVKIGITIVMFLVKKIRNQKSNYLEVPDEVLSWRMVGQIMSLGHVLPSLALTVSLALYIFPLISHTYAEKLESNDLIIPITCFGILIPALILNGIMIEMILEKTNLPYRNYKNEGADAA